MSEPRLFDELMRNGAGANAPCSPLLGVHLSFRTGSRVYGPASPCSDIDFAVLMPYSFHLIAGLRACNVAVTESDYFKAVKFQCLGYTVNLIPLSACDFVAWHKATEAMTLTPSISDKNWRCIVFQQLVQGYKAAGMVVDGLISDQRAVDYIMAKNELTLLDLPALIPIKELPF